MTVKAVVFDIGRVLIEYEPEAFYERELGEERSKDLFNAVDIHAYNLRVDRGDPLVATIEEAAQEAPEYADEIRWWANRWSELVPSEIAGTVHILKTLKAKGVRVLALTNFGAETFEIAQKRFPFLTLFDEEYVSARLKTIKPEPAIYEALEAGSGFSGAELIFTDDSPANVAAAQKRGWHAHLFESSEGWAQYLVDHGVLDASDL